MGVWGPTAEFGKGRGAEGQGLEKGSLAGGVEGLAGVTFPGDTGTAFPRICPRGATTQGDLAAGGVARGRKGTDEVLLLRSAGELHTATLGAHHQVPVEDRTRLPPTQGRTRLGSLRRKKLEWLAPPCDARDVGALLPDPRNVAH